MRNKVIHVGSQSQDVHTNSQADCNNLISAVINAIPNCNCIAIATYLDYTAQISQWATAIHNAGRNMWLRSAGYNDWNGTNGVTQYSSADFDTHSKTQYTSFINSNFSIFQSGDVFECVPDEPENNTMWNTTYGTIGSGSGQTAYNSFITSSISAINTALTNNSVSGVLTGYVHTNPSATRDIMTSATKNTLSALSTDDYPESSSDITAAQCSTKMLSEIKTWINPTSKSISRHITFGPNVNIQLSLQVQSDAINQEAGNIIANVNPGLDGLTIWQVGNTSNSPLSRLFDYASGIWTPRQAALTVNQIFDEEFVVNMTGFVGTAIRKKYEVTGY